MSPAAVADQPGVAFDNSPQTSKRRRGFFETVRIRVVRGASYSDADPACTSGGCSVALSQEMARQLFSGRDALGATVRTDSGVVMRVVGVASYAAFSIFF